MDLDDGSFAVPGVDAADDGIFGFPGPASFDDGGFILIYVRPTTATLGPWKSVAVLGASDARAALLWTEGTAELVASGASAKLS